MSTCTMLARMNYSMNSSNVLALFNITSNLLELEVYYTHSSKVKMKGKKIEPVPIPLPRPSRNFPDIKTRNKKRFYNWTWEIIPFILFGMQMDRT